MSAKHEADFLRDKLLDMTNNLSEAKDRIADLEDIINEENSALKHTLKLLEASSEPGQGGVGCISHDYQN
jgi:hypothetical protein